MNPSDTKLLQQAAEMRAAGQSWEQVAQKIGRSASTIRRWPIKYRRTWQKAYRLAERLLRAEAAAEAIQVLRRDLRSDDEKSHRGAADTILKHQPRTTRAKSAGKAGPKSLSMISEQTLALATHIESLTDGQIDIQLHEFAAEAVAGAAAEKKARPRRKRSV